MNRKTLLTALFVAGAALCSQSVSAQVTYALPQTSITFEIEAVKENFYAGPYAKYAQKYLGIDARQENQSTCTLSSVKMTPHIEADQSARYNAAADKKSESFLALSSQGLIAVSDGISGDGSQWRFAPQTAADFADKGVSSNLTSEATTLYTGSNDNANFSRVAVQQNMVVQKSLEQRAQEAANMIFELRKKRVQIVTGDTDATYSGEAMGSALSEIAALEKEYMSLFIGYSESTTQTFKCDVVPVRGQKNQTYVAFRISDVEGVVSADNVSGRPYLLELVPQTVSQPQGAAKSSKGAYLTYRIPAICSVKLTDGVNPIVQDRVAVYQLGVESQYPM